MDGGLAASMKPGAGLQGGLAASIKNGGLAWPRGPDAATSVDSVRAEAALMEWAAWASFGGLSWVAANEGADRHRTDASTVPTLMNDLYMSVALMMDDMAGVLTADLGLPAEVRLDGGRAINVNCFK